MPLPHNLHVMMDIVNKCNLRCIMCHFSRDEVFFRKATVLCPDDFERIIRDIHRYTAKLTLSAAYEPLVSPHIKDILGIAARYDFKELNFLTNGNLMDRSVIKALFDSGVTEVCISMHGATKKTYESILKGGVHDRVMANISLLISEKKRLGIDRPRLHFNVALMKRNIHEMEELVISAAGLGVASISFRHLIVFNGLGMEEESLAASESDKRRSDYWVRRALEKAAELGLTVLNSPDFFYDPQNSYGRLSRWMGSGVNYLATARKRGWVQFGQGVTQWIDGMSDFLAGGAPMGNTDQPKNGVLWGGRVIEFSGWAVSDTGIMEVEVVAAGQDGNRLFHIGYAQILNAARADITPCYPRFPESFRAGWRFLLHPSDLKGPHEPLFIHIIARSRKGRETTIGVKEIRSGFQSLTEPYIFCTKPFDSVYIDVHGFVYPYPDCHTKVPMGSLGQDSLETIWDSSDFQGFRHRIRDGRGFSFCRRCPVFINRRVDSPEFFKGHSDFSTVETR